jgi:RNA-directed DNA polymerase
MAVEDLQQRGYKPLPLRRIFIPKSNGKMRPLGIPTMKDRAMQALYLLALDPVAETCADPDSYGFRKARSCADAIEQCFKSLSSAEAAEWILEGDIKACFDNIDHDWLMRNVPLVDKRILLKWLEAGYLYGNAFYDTRRGSAQGGVISPTLANITLDGLEQRLAPWISRRTTNGRKAKVHFVRYADDFIVTGSSKELLENEILPVLETFFAPRGLTLSPEKTVITHISEGFDFLGQTIRDYDGKILIRPSKKSVKTFLEKIRATIEGNQAASAHNLICLLNPKIQGWVNYHRHACSKRTFEQIDTAIFKSLWQWAKRRHPDKNRKWIADKYFGTLGKRRWIFFGETQKAKGEPMTRNWLKLAARTPIVRHVKIRKDANPYDPSYDEYFANRKLLTKRGRIAKPTIDYDIQDDTQVTTTASRNTSR